MQRVHGENTKRRRPASGGTTSGSRHIVRDPTWVIGCKSTVQETRNAGCSLLKAEGFSPVAWKFFYGSIGISKLQSFIKKIPRDPPDPGPKHCLKQCSGSGSTGSTCFLASRILLSSCKNSKKNLDSFYFVTLFDFFCLKNDVNVPSKSNKQKKLC
jgi:hypothetical protein